MLMSSSEVASATAAHSRRGSRAPARGPALWAPLEAMARKSTELWGLFEGQWAPIECGFKPVALASFKSVHVLAANGIVHTCPSDAAGSAREIASRLRPEQVGHEPAC